jgi:hypothetical protein
MYKVIYLTQVIEYHKFTYLDHKIIYMYVRSNKKKSTYLDCVILVL